MSGYIDENARIADDIHNAYEEGYADGKRDAVVHGHWIERTDYAGDTYYDCSACGESWTTIEGDPWDNGMNYCPQCGAKMDEVTE